MKHRFRVGVALVTLAVHLFAPFAAYGLPAPGPGFDDFCSANRNVTALSGSNPTLPRPYSPKHVPSHCAFCSGSASPAVLTNALSLPIALAQVEVSFSRAPCALVPAATAPLPPSRGPPSAS